MATKPRKQVHLPPAVCTQEFKDKLQSMADDMDRSMSWVIIRAVEMYMKDYQAQTDAAADDGWKNR